MQDGYGIKQPSGRPMPSIGNRVHELRVDDKNVSWRVVYRIDDDAIVIFDVFAKKRQQTPRQAIKRSQRRIKRYDAS